MNPQTRNDHLLVSDLDDELFVYNMDDDRCHALGPVAALVLKACDGTNTVLDIAQILHETLQIPQSETLALTALTLGELAATGLITPGYDLAAPTRRELLTRLRTLTTATALIPLIHSLTAPPPAMAQSDDPCRHNRCVSGEFLCTIACNACDDVFFRCTPDASPGVPSPVPRFGPCESCGGADLSAVITCTLCP